MNLDQLLQIVVVGDKIENVQEFVAHLETLEMDLNVCEYLESLAMRLQFSEYSNKEELLGIINTKLLNYKINENEMMNNRETLEKLQAYNNDMKKLNIIETGKDENDSHKDIDYITITRENGEVEMLVCMGKNTLHDYINTNMGSAVRMDAEKIFHHLKESVHVALQFYDSKKFATVNPNLAQQAIVREEAIKKQEMDEVEHYCHLHEIEGAIEVTVDPNGERIYKAGTAIIKFFTNYEQKRVMQVLQKEVVKKDTEDLLNELDDEMEKTEIFDVDVLESIHEAAQNYDELNEMKDYVFDLERFNELIANRDIYGIELSSSELMEIDKGIHYLLDTMLDRANRGELVTPEQETLDRYMNTLKEKQVYDNESLSMTENAYLEQYAELREEIKTRGLEKTQVIKKLELNNEKKSSGITTIVMLLEIILLGMLILTILSLDI